MWKGPGKGGSLCRGILEIRVPAFRSAVDLGRAVWAPCRWHGRPLAQVVPSRPAVRAPSPLRGLREWGGQSGPRSCRHRPPQLRLHTNALAGRRLPTRPADVTVRRPGGPDVQSVCLPRVSCSQAESVSLAFFPTNDFILLTCKVLYSYLLKENT